MKLAVLETGRPPEPLARRFGTYPDMYRRMLGLTDELASYDVAGGVLPERPEDHDAYIVSGSPAGVYDPLPWIGQLGGFLREARGKAKLVGICFGHQAMAQAFGGSVTKSDKGWGVGLHDYSVAERQPWMDDETGVAIPASHQDQVIAQPPGAVVTMASPFTPFAGLAWGGEAISFQFHPEFEPDYAKALIETRRERLADADGALASLDRPNDNARVAGWIGRFLKG
ncbi:MAG: glutamine amidotransferase class-I [Alphaproteobacteria bacterium]|jgi:GMP synthase-like glutamine amidotransferase|nr:glutamine amidotransferase class-I [Alphaproteobacteria bacterium]